MKQINIPIINMIATGQNIANIRKEKGITIKELQSIMGFNNPGAIHKWQRGESLPTMDNMVILAAIFEVNINDIIVIQS